VIFILPIPKRILILDRSSKPHSLSITQTTKEETKHGRREERGKEGRGEKAETKK
jgi:hypothetical protein